MKALLLFAAAVCFAAAAYSQAGPVTIQNNTNCAYWVNLTAAPACGSITCSSGTICIPPLGTVAVPPCGPGTWIWELITVTPVDAATCTLPCGPPVTVSQTGCAPMVQAGTPCNACAVSFVADYSIAPGVLMIN